MDEAFVAFIQLPDMSDEFVVARDGETFYTRIMEVLRERDIRGSHKFWIHYRTENPCYLATLP